MSSRVATNLLMVLRVIPMSPQSHTSKTTKNTVSTIDVSFSCYSQLHFELWHLKLIGWAAPEIRESNA